MLSVKRKAIGGGIIQRRVRARRDSTEEIEDIQPANTPPSEHESESEAKNDRTPEVEGDEVGNCSRASGTIINLP
jgi:hypothetical protein